MIRLAKENLANFSHIQFIKMDVSEIELKEKVDVIFSNAVLHWILNHKKVFELFWQILKPDGQLLIQCGGYRNLTKTLSIFNKVTNQRNFIIILATVKVRIFVHKHGILPKKKIQKRYYKN